ncbi:hypothetical protein NOMA109596_11535 [Nocardioides marinus]
MGQVRIDERSGLGGELTGDLGDPPDAPHLHLAVEESLPDLRQSVAGFDRIRDQYPAGVGGAAQRRGELDDRELRHLGGAGAGELEHGVGAGHPEPGDPRVLSLSVGVLVGQPVGAVEVGHQLAGGVPVGPLSDRDEPIPVGLIGSLVEVADGGQQVTGRDRSGVLCRVILVPECHVQILLEHLFEEKGEGVLGVNLWRTIRPQPKRAPQRCRTVRSDRNQVPKSMPTASTASKNEGPAAARTSRRPPTPTTESKQTGGCAVKGGHDRPSRRPVGTATCRRTGSRRRLAGARLLDQQRVGRTIHAWRPCA